MVEKTSLAKEVTGRSGTSRNDSTANEFVHSAAFPATAVDSLRNVLQGQSSLY